MTGNLQGDLQGVLQGASHGVAPGQPIPVHRDWHLAGWARGLADQGAADGGLADALLADVRLQPRLMLMAAQGRVLPAMADLPGDEQRVLAWFAQVPPGVIFAQLGMLCHAGRWGESLASAQGRGVPDWVQLDDIKAALTVLQGMPGAEAFRRIAAPVGPDDLLAHGKGLVAGWWQGIDPALATVLGYACAVELTANLPAPVVDAALCGRAALALAMAAGVAGPLDAAVMAVLPDAMQNGGFDD